MNAAFRHGKLLDEGTYCLLLWLREIGILHAFVVWRGLSSSQGYWCVRMVQPPVWLPDLVTVQKHPRVSAAGPMLSQVHIMQSSMVCVQQSQVLLELPYKAWKPSALAVINVVQTKTECSCLECSSEDSYLRTSVSSWIPLLTDADSWSLRIRSHQWQVGAISRCGPRNGQRILRYWVFLWW